MIFEWKTSANLNRAHDGAHFLNSQAGFANPSEIRFLFREMIQGLIGFVRGAHQLVVFGQTRQGFHIVRIGEQNLLPQLNRHVRPAARFEGTGFVDQGDSCGFRTATRGVLLSEAQLERQ